MYDLVESEKLTKCKTRWDARSALDQKAIMGAVAVKGG